jgi:amino acid adenylation domain-containing protein
MNQENRDIAAQGRIPRRDAADAARLSFDQERLWYIEQVSPGTPLYNIPLAWDLQGPLQVPLFESCLAAVVARHEILRTAFALQAETPVQVVSPSGELPLTYVDLGAGGQCVSDDALDAAMTEVAERPFDLASPPLFRSALFRLSDDEHVFLFVPHHTVFDGWSRRLLMDELVDLYAAGSDGRESPLAPLPLQYADFAEWQRSGLDDAKRETLCAFWRETLADAPATLELPGARPRPEERSYRGHELRATWPGDLVQRVKELARHEKVTPFVVVLAAYKALLHRFTRGDDVVVACPVTTRRRSELAALIGFFVNTLPIRTRFSPGMTFRELVQAVHLELLDADANVDLPFQELVRAVAPERASHMTPLFQTMFTFDDLSDMVQAAGDLAVRPRHARHDAALTDLVFACEVTASGLEATLTYSDDIHDEAPCRRLVDHYGAILKAALGNPTAAVDALPLLLPQEQRMLVAWNDTTVDYPAAASVQELFERQADRTPDAVALLVPVPCGADVGVEESAAPAMTPLTYAELNRRANRIAHFLRARGVGPDVPVGLCAERSTEALIGMLGILKAGGGYVPLDPSYPPRRLELMLETSRAPVLLAQERTATLFDGCSAEVVCLDRDGSAIGQCSDVTPEVAGRGESLAYIIFTSGSTGEPKGVAMPHAPLLNLLAWQARNSSAGQGTRTLQFTPLSFDVSFQEILSTWCTGGTLVMVSDELRRDPFALAAFLDAASVERLFLPFVALQCLADAAVTEGPVPSSLREVITAGEQLRVTPALVAFFEQSTDCRLWNHYGPTETHVVTAHRLEGPPADWPALPPIGRPIGNTIVCLLDAGGEAVPIGEPGELYIGGVAPARGYVSRPDLTPGRFVTDSDGERLYRTGDQARYLSGGDLEFLGRRDEQVKIRGFRVEPAEVELALGQHGDVAQGVVVFEQDGSGEGRLVAYVVPSAGCAPTTTDIRSHLRRELPEYMIPQQVVTVESLPTTPSGKIDRTALSRSLDALAEAPSATVPPRTPGEERLASIWRDVLGVRQVGCHDNFFDLGGHSLLAIKLVVRIRAELGVRITPHQVLFSSLEQLARECEAQPVPSDAKPSVLSRLFRRNK